MIRSAGTNIRKAVPSIEENKRYVVDLLVKRAHPPVAVISPSAKRIGGSSITAEIDYNGDKYLFFKNNILSYNVSIPANAEASIYLIDYDDSPIQPPSTQSQEVQNYEYQ